MTDDAPAPLAPPPNWGLSSYEPDPLVQLWRRLRESYAANVCFAPGPCWCSRCDPWKARLATMSVIGGE
jgi:hypothetical protein